jgi:UDP-N-acetylmuramyl pentapeptide phosphotransferase/UDP-N-acetylglucosamine-1-phosphate transferase
MTAAGAEGWRIWLVAGAPLAAAALSALLIAMLKPLLQRYALAMPNARSSHRVPTPQGGGVAVVASTIIVTLGSASLLGDTSGAAGAPILIVLAAAVLIGVVGGIDDLRPMPVVPRLVLQAIAIGAAIAAMPAEVRILPWLPWWAERLGLLIGLLWFVNLVNFMDGIDWMTVAEVVPVTAAIAVTGVVGRISLPSTLLDLALLGAVLGFAPFNKPVARLFLGDVGSLPIGLLLGSLLFELAQAGEIAAAALLPLYYLADTTLTLFRRIVAREPFWQSHRSHFYQRACDMGFSVPEIVGRVFVLNLVLAGLALLTIAYQSPRLALGALAAGIAAVGWLLRRFSSKRR